MQLNLVAAPKILPTVVGYCSKTLFHWASQVVKSGVTLNADGLTYNTDAKIARIMLIHIKGWMIDGDIYIL
jgi:hypothetical protein